MSNDVLCRMTRCTIVHVHRCTSTSYFVKCLDVLCQMSSTSTMSNDNGADF